jgi:hypothetical protein
LAIVRKLNAEISAYRLAFLERIYEHNNRARNVTLASFPTSDGSSALDANEARESFGTKAEGTASGLQLRWRHSSPPRKAGTIALMTLRT